MSADTRTSITGEVPPEHGELSKKYRDVWIPSGVRWSSGIYGSEGEHRYSFRRRDPIPLDRLREGLFGDTPVIAVPSTGGACHWIGIDLDDIQDATVFWVAAAIAETGIAPTRNLVLLRSGGPRRFHLFLVFDTPIAISQARLVISALRTALHEVGVSLPERDFYPESSLRVGFRLPGMANPKYARLSKEEVMRRGASTHDILIAADTLQPIDDPLAILADPPRTDGAKAVEAAECLMADLPDALPEDVGGAVPAEIGPGREFYLRFPPCVRRFLVEPITEPETRHERFYGIAASLQCCGATRSDVYAVLEDCSDRLYEVRKGGSSRRDRRADATKLARGAEKKSLRFNCRRRPDIYRPFCEEGCRYRRIWGVRVNILGFPAFDPQLSEMGPAATQFLLRYFSIARTHAVRGYFYLSAADASDGYSEITERKYRKKLIERGYLEHVSPDQVPLQVLEQNGHRDTPVRKRPSYFVLGPALLHAADPHPVAPSPRLNTERRGTGNAPQGEDGTDRDGGAR